MDRLEIEDFNDLITRSPTKDSHFLFQQLQDLQASFINISVIPNESEPVVNLPSFEARSLMKSLNRHYVLNTFFYSKVVEESYFYGKLA